MSKAKKKPSVPLTDAERGELPDAVTAIYDSLATSSSDEDLDAAERKAASRRRDSFLKHVREQVEAPDPLSPYEVQARRATELKFELEALRFELEASTKEGKDLRTRIKGLEREIRTAKGKSKPFRARIKTLPSKWQKQWIVVYDQQREAGKPKPEASALAWASVKVHCTRTAPGTWSCPDWDDAFRDSAKEKARIKKRLAAGDAASEKALKKIDKRKAKLIEKGKR